MEINGPWAAAGYRSAGINLGIAPVPVGPAGPVTLGLDRAADGRPSPASTRRRPRSSSPGGPARRRRPQFSKISGFPPVRTDLAARRHG